MESRVRKAKRNTWGEELKNKAEKLWEQIEKEAEELEKEAKKLKLETPPDAGTAEELYTELMERVSQKIDKNL